MNNIKLNPKNIRLAKPSLSLHLDTSINLIIEQPASSQNKPTIQYIENYIPQKRKSQNENALF